MAEPYRQKHENRLERDDDQRRKGRLAGLYLMAGGALGFALVPLFGAGPAIFGVILGGAGITVFGLANTATKGTCPSCGGSISWVGNEPLQRCPGCEDYVRIERGVITALERSFVAEEQSFLITVAPGEEAKFPPLCSGCGACATRALPYQTGRTTWFELAPHCDRCVDGASRSMEGVRVRSLSLYRATIETRRNAQDLETSEIENTSTSTPGL